MHLISLTTKMKEKTMNPRLIYLTKKTSLRNSRFGAITAVPTIAEVKALKVQKGPNASGASSPKILLMNAAESTIFAVERQRNVVSPAIGKFLPASKRPSVVASVANLPSRLSKPLSLSQKTPFAVI